MMNRRRAFGSLLALVLPAAMLVALPVTNSAAATAPATPPTCAYNDPDTNCVHGPTPDITALPAPAYTTTYDAKTKLRTVIFSAAIVAPYHTCPDGGVPISFLPCTFRGLGVGSRVYQPGATLAAGTGGAVPVPAGANCDFSCTAELTFGYEYHGPATVILTFSVGELLQGQNDLATSSYETTITLPADPVTGVIHVTKPSVVYTGALRTMTLHLAGHGGIPRSGVGGIIVRVVGAGEGQIKGGDGFGNSFGVLEVVPGTTLKLVKDSPGTVSATTMGWYSSAPATTGDLFHGMPRGAKKLRLGSLIALTPTGIPADATAVLVAVLSPKGTTKVGGIAVHDSYDGEYVLAPLKPGAHLAVTAAKSASVVAYGYTEPIHAIDTGSTLAATYPDALANIYNLPEQN